MIISNKTYFNMNHLVSSCFNANAVFDNLAYNLDYYFLNEIGRVLHLKVAHIMPEWADKVSDKMLELGARPVRGKIGSYDEDIPELQRIFEIYTGTLMALREEVIRLIDDADLEGDAEARIFGEDFLTGMTPYIKQAEEWLNAASKMDAYTLNNHIKKYTHFIKL